MRILIVDDEPIARDILETYVLRLTDATLAGKCKNALEAFGTLSREQVDVMLLDINMPEISGTELINTLKNPPLVIFTTAYSEYAVESYELNALDYLLKPISFERFLKAINKANDTLRQASVQTSNEIAAPSLADEKILFVKSGSRLLKVDISRLWLIEGLKDYVRLWIDNNPIVVHITMKSIEDQLAGTPFFVRINKSYIINIRFVDEIDGNVLRLKGQSVTIGNTYRGEVHDLFNKMKLL